MYILMSGQPEKPELIKLVALDSWLPWKVLKKYEVLLVLCKGVNKGTHSTLVLGVFCEFSYLLSYPGYFREPHWIHSMGIPEISRVTWRVFVLSCSSGKPFAWSPCHEWPTNTRKKTMNSTCMGSRTVSIILTTHNSIAVAAVSCRHP